MVRTRFAPSPTGELHLGGLRTALFSYALARRHQGEFRLRIEDTDAPRTVPGAEDRLKQALARCGLAHDGPVVRQSDRLPTYRTYAQGLVDEGHAYLCFCSKERLDGLRKATRGGEEGGGGGYDGKCASLSKEEARARAAGGEPYVVRMRAPARGDTHVQDLVAGPVRFANSTMDDQVLLKADGWPTYHLAAVVDDHEMGITHVVRGNEWLASTPKHLALHRMLGWDAPAYAHLPLLVTPDGKKLSKRSEMGVPVLKLLERGYLPSALVNFVALLGWGPPAKYNLVLSLRDICDEFSLEAVTKGDSVVDEDRLHWVNGMHIRRAVSAQAGGGAGGARASPEAAEGESLARDFAKALQDAGLVEAASPPDPERVRRVLDLLKERAFMPADFVRLGAHFFRARLELDVKGLEATKGSKVSARDAEVLGAAAELLADARRPARDLEELHAKLGVRKRDVLGVLRWALTGTSVGAPLPDTVDVMGRDVAVARVRDALGVLAGAAAAGA